MPAARSSPGRGSYLSDRPAAELEKPHPGNRFHAPGGSWDDVVLPDETRDELAAFIHSVKEPDLAAGPDLARPAALLLHGPPGVGKTLVAHVIAKELHRQVIQVSARELMAVPQGVERSVAALFARALAHAPSVLVLGECEALIGPRRSRRLEQPRVRAMRRLLHDLAALRSRHDVLVIGETSRLDIMDADVVDHWFSVIEIGLPDAVGRLRILRALCRDTVLSNGVNLPEIAALTGGLAGADLQALRTEAVKNALARATKNRSTGCHGDGDAALTMGDLRAALTAMRSHASLFEV